MTEWKRVAPGILVGCLLTLPAQAEKGWTPERSLEVKRLSDVSFAPDGTELLYGIQSTDLERDEVSLNL